MKPVVTAVALEYRDTFTFAKLDVNTEEEKTIEYRIRVTPTYIVFRDGEVVGRFTGAVPSTKLVQRILDALGIQETEETE